MPLITQGKTNWKFLLIVIILAVIVGVGALWYAKRLVQSYQPPEIKNLENVTATELEDLKVILKDVDIIPKDWDFIFTNAGAINFDINKDGNSDLIIAKKEGEGILGPYFRLYIMSWDGEKFFEIWKSPYICSTLDEMGILTASDAIYTIPMYVYPEVVDIDNDRRYEIIVEDTLSWPFFYYDLFEYGKSSYKLYEINSILRKLMDRKTAEIHKPFYWWITEIKDNDGDGLNEILMDIHDKTPQESPFASIKWEEILSEFAKWKTYSSKIYGFKVSYPENFIAYEEDSSFVTIYRPTLMPGARQEIYKEAITENPQVGEVAFTIKVYPKLTDLPENSQGLSFKEWIAKQINTGIYKKTGYVKIAGEYQFQIKEGQGFESIFLTKNNTVYRIILGQVSPEMDELTNEILPSFGFVE
jgi:hypothetical protein